MLFRSVFLTYGHTFSQPASLNAASMSGGAQLVFSVSPALPWNVTLDTSTGVISGTPTELNVAGMNHTVTATNSGGSTTFTMFIKVWPVCPVVQFETASYTLTRATTAIKAEVRNVAGKYAPLASCAVSPALPSGLHFNGHTCEVYGTPEVVSWPAKRYTATASNACGSHKTSVTIEIGRAHV